MGGYPGHYSVPSPMPSPYQAPMPSPYPYSAGPGFSTGPAMYTPPPTISQTGTTYIPTLPAPSYSMGGVHQSYYPAPYPVQAPAPIYTGSSRSMTEYNFGTYKHPYLPMPI